MFCFHGIVWYRNCFRGCVFVLLSVFLLVLRLVFLALIGYISEYYPDEDIQYTSHLQLNSAAMCRDFLYDGLDRSEGKMFR